MTFTRANLFRFESETLQDEELDKGILSENKINIATIIIFSLLELMVIAGFYLYDYTLPQFGLLSLVGLLTARQIALDFAYHVFLDIYTLPMALAAFLAPALLFNEGTVLQSIAYGCGFALLMLSITLGCSWLKGKAAGIGGGDIKFALVMGGFLPGFILTICVFLSCMLSLVLTTFYEDKKNIPFGPGLLISFWICLIFKQEILTFVFKVLG